MPIRSDEIAKELAETAALLARAAERLSRLAARIAENPAQSAGPVRVAGYTPDSEQYLTTNEAAGRLSATPAGLAALRARGKGPPYIRIGKAVRYPASRLHENTGQALSLPRKS